MTSFLQRTPLVMIVILLALGGVAVTQSAIAAPASAPQAQSTAGWPTVCPWLDCKVAAISYSQDDAANINPTLTNTNSCQIPLENAGLRGTFFFEGTTSPSWLSILTSAGHEVGSHLANHQLNCAQPPACAPNCTLTSLLQIPYTITDVDNFRENQLDPNVSAIESTTGQAVVAMAYACGNTDPGRMAAAQYYYLGARGYYDIYGSQMAWVYDINTPTPAQPMLLNADTYFSQTLVDRAINEGGWEIVTVHDYCAGVTELENISDTVWIAPIGEVLKYIQVRNATQFTNYVRAGYNISFDAVHTLSTFQRQQLNGTPLLPIVFDNPVTIRTPITDTANVVSVRLNGTEITYTVGTISGTKYVWFDTPLSTIQHVNIQLDTPTAVKVSNLHAVGSMPDLLSVLIAAGSAGAGVIILWKRRRS